VFRIPKPTAATSRHQLNQMTGRSAPAALLKAGISRPIETTWSSGSGKELPQARTRRYGTIVRGPVIPGIEAQEIPSFLHVDLARRLVPGGVEFLTIIWFESLESVERFVGEDHAAAHGPAEARAVLSSFEERATHFEVLDRRPQPYARPPG
jgi:hypothetical protein